jgi:4-hydroxy-tetrahydrodipicolinate reductase
MSVSVIVNGAAGKMGRIAVSAIQSTPEFSLAAEAGSRDDLSQVIKKHPAAIVIDFTTPHAVFQNTQTILQAGARPVIGTTGLTAEQIKILGKMCAEKHLGGVIAPNFSQGAVLMMRFAQEAARYFPNVEVIEMHHPQKLDAPSGTAVKTAQMIAEFRDAASAYPIKDSPARGENHSGVQIHSVRLPGFYSHQTVIFGSVGEVLSICHQGIDRQCCIPGIILACQKVLKLDHLVYGLENLLFES